LWEVDNYEAFLDRRRQLIAGGINEYMERLLKEDSQSELDVATLIAQGEGKRLEFKARFHGGSEVYPLEEATVKAVAGLLNAEGGRVVLGVKDDGKIIGVEGDYQLQGKKNRDGFEIELSNKLEGKLGAGVLPLVRVHFVKIQDHDVCVIQVTPSSKPVYMKDGDTDKFYVRLQNSTRAFSIEEATEYIQERF
jgi:predicted HTH transcriptional regulator